MTNEMMCYNCGKVQEVPSDRETAYRLIKKYGWTKTPVNLDELAFYCRECSK